MLTRFAPAPTGLLHLGHVANAIYVWGLAARAGAGVLLRIEDHDRQRSRPAYESRLLDDLDWLGFAPDRFRTNEFRQGTCDARQSDRGAVYADAADQLIARGLVYACTCSRQHSSSGRYPGTCGDRRLGLIGDVAWRVRIEGGAEAFDDLLRGPHTQEPAALSGDPVIRDRLGNWTYQFAVTVDDLHQDIDLVIRGEDLLSSTGLQIRLARMLGRTSPPRFAHHPLIMKSADQKLSKSDGDTGIESLRAAGWSAGDVIGAAAHRVGLVSAPKPIPAGDVSALFGA